MAKTKQLKWTNGSVISVSTTCPFQKVKMSFSAPPSYRSIMGLSSPPTQEQKFPSFRLNQIYRCTTPEDVYAKWRYVQIIGIDEERSEVAFAPFSTRTCNRTSNFDYQDATDFLTMYTLNISNTMKSLSKAQNDKAKRKTKRTK